MPTEIAVKSILNKTKQRDPWFLDDYTANPYSGCSFNCLFCYIRGSKYGEHMEEKLGIKVNGPDLLEKALKRRAEKGQYGIVVLSSATDPYLHFEKEYRITRHFLEILLKYRFPVHIITRSNLVLRDLDILSEIDKVAILPTDLSDNLRRGTIITFSFSTVSDPIARVFEPGATAPSLRLETLSAVRSAGFLSGISLMPLLPFISDTGEHLEQMFCSFQQMDAQYILPATLTLFGNGASDSKTLVLRAVARHYPHLLEKYHRFFENSQEMPSYYKSAFTAKMSEMHEKYKIRNRIIG